jgi:hypothetical protein
MTRPVLLPDRRPTDGHSLRATCYATIRRSQQGTVPCSVRTEAPSPAPQSPNAPAAQMQVAGPALGDQEEVAEIEGAHLLADEARAPSRWAGSRLALGADTDL